MPTPPLTRRSFLKVAALGSAAAAGCHDLPARELIPYVIPDEHVIPGVPSFYAGVCRECPAGCSIIARVREGRVIKLEGNPRDPIGGGALCARGQAALQGLYNPDRLDHPHRRANGQEQALAWDTALEEFADRLRAAVGAGADRIAFVGPCEGPTLDRIIDGWLQQCGSQRRVRYAALGEPEARAAGAACFGRSDLPVLRIDSADVVLSLDADFLETWRSPVELTRQYAAFRAPRAGADGQPTIGRAVYVGPRLGLTAANCDEWIAVAPGDEALIGAALLHELVRGGANRAGVPADTLSAFVAACTPAAVAQRTGVAVAIIQRLAATLSAAQHPVVLAGTADRPAHVVAAALNAVTGALGTTIRFLDGAQSPAPSSPQDVGALIDAMRSGTLDVVVIAGGNPAFSAAGFADALGHVPFVVWCGGVPDETAQYAHLLLPCHHALETWSDSAPRPGIALFGQPVTQAVVDSRPLGDVLLAALRSGGAAAPGLPWSDTHAAAEASWREQYAQRGAPATAFEAFGQSIGAAGGVFEEAPAATVALRAEALAPPLELGARSDELICAAWPHPFLYDGSGADKPWLQEIPEPVAQFVWDTWIELHPETADRLGIGDDDLVEVRSVHGRFEAPARRTPHVARSAVAVPFGQGHTAYGRYASGRGANPWQILPLGMRSVAVTLHRTGARRQLVTPLGLPQMLDRPIAEAMTLAELRSGATRPASDLPVPELHEMRTAHEYPEHEWGMTIDLNACTGCSACVAACYAENNLAVVGREEVARGHIMSWIRIERFEPTAPDDPLLYLMPMLCQQCDRAPCEAVCPVFASYHTEEGLNGQVYNRCVGTRYCSNNCPYKVRRFNWFDHPRPSPLELQLNPDVTVRGAGVMEKCTFCIQRIRAAEMDAHAAARALRDGDLVPACAQACPARAISFGDLKDGNSAVMRRRAEHPLRSYRALEVLNTNPAIVYLRDLHRRGEET